MTPSPSEIQGKIHTGINFTCIFSFLLHTSPCIDLQNKEMICKDGVYGGEANQPMLEPNFLEAPPANKLFIRIN